MSPSPPPTVFTTFLKEHEWLGEDILLAWVVFKGVDTDGTPKTFEWAGFAPIALDATYREPRVLSFGPYERRLSDRSGRLESATCTFQLSDVDNLLRGFLANAFQIGLLNTEVTIKLSTKADVVAAVEPFVYFRGLVQGYRAMPGFQFEFSCWDWLSARIGHPLPLKTLGDTFSLVPEANRTRVGPIWYGPMSNGASATPAPLYNENSSRGFIGSWTAGYGDLGGTPPTNVVLTENLGAGTLAAFRTFYVGVTSVNGSGHESDPDTFNAASWTTITTSSAGSAFTATWSAAAGAVAYRVYVGVSYFGIRLQYYLQTAGTSAQFTAVADYPTEASVASNSTAGALFGGLASYQYVVTALMSDGETSPSEVATGVDEQLVRPFYLQWTAVPGAIEYHVYRAPSGQGYRWAFRVPPNTTEFVDDFSLDGATVITGLPPTTGLVSCPYVGKYGDEMGGVWHWFVIANHAIADFFAAFVDEDGPLAAAQPASITVDVTSIKQAPNATDPGSATNNVRDQLQITTIEKGDVVNKYDLTIEKSDGANQPISVAFTYPTLRIKLASDGSGNPDDTVNTAANIAQAINDAGGFTAEVVTPAPVGTKQEVAQNFSGGAARTTDSSQRVRTRVDDAQYGVDWLTPRMPGWSTYFPSQPNLYWDAGDGTRWSLILTRSGQTSEDLASGISQLWVNIGGVETRGDGTGARIDNGVLQLGHLEDNFILTDTPYVGGLWATSPPAWSDSTPRRDQDVYLRTASAMALSMGTGTRAWGIIEALTMLDIEGRVTLSTDTAYGWSHDGKLRRVLEPPDYTLPAPVADFTEITEIASDSFSFTDTVDPNVFFNKMNYAYAPTYGLDGSVSYSQTATIEDTDAKALIFRGRSVIASETLNFYANQAFGPVIALRDRKLARAVLPTRDAPFKTGLHALSAVELGDVIRVTHREGVGPVGYVQQQMMVRGIQGLVNDGGCGLTARDLGFGTATTTSTTSQVFSCVSDAEQVVTLEATVLDSSGNIVNEGTVTFVVYDADGAPVGATAEGSVVAGHASASWNMPVGLGCTGGAVLTVIATYSGTSNFGPSAGQGTITVGAGEGACNVVYEESFAAGQSNTSMKTDGAFYNVDPDPGLPDPADPTYPYLKISENIKVIAGAGPSGEHVLEPWQVSGSPGAADSAILFDGFGGLADTRFDGTSLEVYADYYFDSATMTAASGFAPLLQIYGLTKFDGTDFPRTGTGAGQFPSYGSGDIYAAIWQNSGDDWVFELQYRRANNGAPKVVNLTSYHFSKAAVQNQWHRIKILLHCASVIDWSLIGSSNDSGAVDTDGWLKVYLGNTLVYNLTGLQLVISPRGDPSLANRVQAIALGFDGLAGPVTNLHVCNPVDAV